MIVAIDPGGETGIAMLTLNGEHTAGQVPGGFDGLSDWLHRLPWGGVSAVVCETFIPRPGAKSTQLDAIWLIGAIKHLCRHYCVPLIMQSPAQAKSFATNDALKAVGWYTVGMDHARDADRHLLVFVASNPVAQQLVPGTRERVLGALVAA